MPERTVLTELTQLGVETTPGTVVPANRVFRDLAITPGVKAAISTPELAGQKWPTVAIFGKEWSESKFEGAGFESIVYVLSSLLSYADPVRVNPPSGIAWRWTFRPAQSQPDTIKTYTIEVGSSVRAAQVAYGLVTGATISVNRNAVEVSGSLLGQRIADGITMTANPAEVPAVPFVPGKFDLFIDSTAGALGTTKMLRAFSIEFSVSDRYSPVWSVNSALSSFAAHVETRPAGTLKLRLEADAQGRSLLDVMRNGTKRFIRLLGTGPIIEGTTAYSLQIDMCGLVVDAPAQDEEDSVVVDGWTLTPAFDAGWGKALEIQVVNTRSAL